MAISIWARSLARGVNTNSPTIMSGLAVVGVISTVVLAVRATPKAVEKIEREKFSAAHRKADEEEVSITVDDVEESLPPLEIVKATWKFYLPAAVSGAATIALVIGANRVGVHRQVAMAGAYTLLDTAFRHYKEEVIEQIGETKERKIAEGVIKKEMDRTPIKNAEIIMVGDGDQDFFEPMSGRYFKSKVHAVERAEIEFNRGIINAVYGSTLNEWYEYLGLAPTAIGDHLGFNVDRMVEIRFVGHITDDQTPCLALDYKNRPFEGFSKI